MEKQLQQTLGQVTMYSKMGRYISNKILKYNKTSSPTHHIAKVMAPPPYEYLKPSKPKDDSPGDQKMSKTSFSLQNRFGKDDNNKLYMTQPPVGYYKVNHSYVDKNVHQYNFDQSVPHFERQKFHCHESQPVCKDYPDVTTSKPYVQGLVEVGRMVGRQFTHASVRRFLEDPHENRYILTKDHRSSVENPKSRVNFKKNLPRGNEMFKSAQFTPDYNVNAQFIKKRLDTHGLGFQNQLPRDGGFLDAKTGISDCFENDEAAVPKKYSFNNDRSVEWKKQIGRQKLGLLPAYMDKSIHTRMNLTQINMKQLEMNCTSMKKKQMKAKGKKKKNKNMEEYIEEDWDKQNNPI